MSNVTKKLMSAAGGVAAPSFLVETHNNTPYFTIYSQDGDTFTKLAAPAVIPGTVFLGWGAQFSDDNTYLAIGFGDTVEHTPYFFIYKREGDVFTKLPDPAALPGGPVFDIALR